MNSNLLLVFALFAVIALGSCVEIENENVDKVKEINHDTVAALHSSRTRRHMGIGSSHSGASASAHSGSSTFNAGLGGYGLGGYNPYMGGAYGLPYGGGLGASNSNSFAQASAGSQSHNSGLYY